MNLAFKKVSWRYLALALLVVALVTTTAFSLAAHSGTVGASQAKRVKISGHPFTSRYGGTVDLSKLPRITQSTQVTAKTLPQVNRDRMTPAQRAAYQASLKKNLSALPKTTQGLPTPAAAASAAQVAQNAANSTNPNFDICGYQALPCPVHQFNGQNITQSGGWIPPDQALATNPSFVMEGNNNVLSVYGFTGAQVYGPTSTFSFFSGVLHTNDILSDPQIYWDATRLHWVIVEVEFSSDLTHSYLDIGVSKTQNATVSAPSQWYLYQLNHAAITSTFCDYPTLGNDYWGMWISCVDFGLGGGSFTGNTVYGLNKNTAYAGTGANGYFFTNIPNGIGGSAFRLSPVSEDGTPDAEFLVATAAGFGSGNNALVTCAFTFTRGIEVGTSPTASCVAQSAPNSYSDPFSARESGGTGIIDPGFGTKQLYYKGGNIFLAMVTATGNANDGVWWAEIQPQLTGLNPANPGAQLVQNSIIRQNAVLDYSNSAFDAYMPSIIGSSEDDVVLVYNYSSATIEPGIVYTGRRATDAPSTMGDGNNSAFIVGGSNPNDDGRWGDYSACSLDTNLTSRGLVWCAGEYGGSHSSGSGSGWDTYVYALEVE